jgi:hypothetical protein
LPPTPSRISFLNFTPLALSLETTDSRSSSIGKTGWVLALGLGLMSEYGRYAKPLRGARGGAISSCAGGCEAA